MKKIILSTLLLALPLLASAYDAEVNGIYYNLNSSNQTAEVTSGRYTGYSGSIAIPDKFTYEGVEYTVTSIGNDAFYVCSRLTSVTIPNTVTSIGNQAFENCSSLTSVTIPNSVTRIGNDAFASCWDLISVTIPNSVTNIGACAFANCNVLSAVNITDLEAWCNIDFGQWDANPLYNAHHLYLNGEEIKDLIIPNSVKKLKRYTFVYCTGLTSATIPNSVTVIGYQTFGWCTGLTSVTIGDSVTTIGGGAFWGCTGLTSVIIPSSVTSIENSWPWGTFGGCTGLTTVSIPNSVTSIGSCAFENCSGLTSVTIPNSVTTIGSNAFRYCSGLASVTIPSSVSNIGRDAFFGCSSLTAIRVESENTKYNSQNNCNAIIESASDSLILGCRNTVIPNSVRSIGDNAFYGCSSLTSVTIPNSVTSIGNDAFSWCTGLTSVTIPNSVTSIGEHAFRFCSGLTSVISRMEIPCFIDFECFYDVFNYVTLYVPKGTVDLYKSTDYWNKFVNIKEGEPGGSAQPENNKCATPTISYADKKLTFACETEGVEYHYTITDSDIKSDVSSSIDLSATYNISVYATKLDFEDSDVAMATLVWTDAIFTETTPEPATSAKAVQESIPVLISAKGGNISVKCEADGQEVNVYTIDGLSLGTATVKNGEALISNSIPSGDIAVVKVGGRSVKVLMR